MTAPPPAWTPPTRRSCTTQPLHLHPHRPAATGAALRALLVAAILLVAGCGAAEGDADSGGGGPTVASPDLAGRWSVSGLAVDGSPVTQPVTALLQLETDFGGVEVDTDCGTSIGAFTLDADGVAGFSLAGGSTTECPADVRRGRDQLLSVLGDVEAWSGDGQRIELTAPDGSSVELTR